MPFKKRLISEKLQRLFAAFPVVVLTGARQVGKSTLLQKVFPNLSYVQFDSDLDIGAARQDPDLFLDNHRWPLILDEIQFAAPLVSAIKRRVDQYRQPGMYLLTGSQQWSVLKNISESLAGRAVFVQLEGFTLSEIAQQTEAPSWLARWLDDPNRVIAEPPTRLNLSRTLYEQLWYGWLPYADTLPQDLVQTFYRGYLQTYIERDARLIQDVLDWQQFGRFVQLVSALSAQEINHTQLGRELGISCQTARRWLAALVATFQWYEIPPFSKNNLKKVVSKPKGYFADTGLICSLQRISSPLALAGHPLTGALFETAVAAHLRRLSEPLATPPQMYYWRTYGGAEVDIVLERDGVLFPIEIKLTSQPNRRDAQGIEAFRRTYPDQKIAPGLVICPCREFVRISDRDYALPWDSL